MIGKLFLRTVLLMLVQVAYAAPEEPFRFNMPQGATATSHAVYDLHMLVLWVCAVIGAGVFLVMAWSLWRHRRARGVTPSRFSGNNRLEIIWAIIPVLILIGIAIPATKVLLAVNSQAPADLTVDIRGSQWKWQYSYVEQGITLDSNLAADSREASRKGGDRAPSSVPNYLRDVDRPLVLPVGKNIRLRITSNDVIHSWWVPELGFKRDAIPGFINQIDIVIDRPGIYRGQCAELCGSGHALMPIVVQAVSPKEFQAWVAQGEQDKAEVNKLAEKPWTRQLALAQGKEIYDATCAACHQPNGKGLPPTFPALDGSKVVNGPVQEHVRFVVHGSPRNPVMRAFGKDMNDRQLAAVLTYERNTWSNHTGDLVTPQQVEEAR